MNNSSRCDITASQPHCSTLYESGQHVMRIIASVDACHQPARLFTEFDMGYGGRWRYAFIAGNEPERHTGLGSADWPLSVRGVLSENADGWHARACIQTIRTGQNDCIIDQHLTTLPVCAQSLIFNAVPRTYITTALIATIVVVVLLSLSLLCIALVRYRNLRRHMTTTAYVRHEKRRCSKLMDTSFLVEQNHCCVDNSLLETTDVRGTPQHKHSRPNRRSIVCNEVVISADETGLLIPNRHASTAHNLYVIDELTSDSTSLADTLAGSSRLRALIAGRSIETQTSQHSLADTGIALTNSSTTSHSPPTTTSGGSLADKASPVNSHAGSSSPPHTQLPILTLVHVTESPV